MKGDGLTKACLRSSETRRSHWHIDYAEKTEERGGSVNDRINW
jgi:Uri superfamily endonuclease